MPLETPPWRVKNPWLHAVDRGEARRAENFILSGVTMGGAQSED